NDGEQNDRPFRPRYNDGGEQGERRPFRPRYNDGGEQGERRPFRPRYNDSEQNDRPFRPRYNDGGEQGERRPFRPRYNDGEQGERRPFRPRFNDGEQGERRSFRPRFNDGDRQSNRRFGGERGGRFNGGRNQSRGGRPAPRQHWKVADAQKGGPHFKIDSRIFDNEQEEQAMGNDPERMEMPETLRLNRFIAMSGVCSRREADELIKAGKVKVNGEVVTEMGVTVSPDADVEYDGKKLKAEKKVYVLLNKPKDCVTTTDDPEGRRTVMDIVANASEARIYPVGRLDRNTTGILLLTNDGDMAEKLTHPRYEVRKIYHVFLDKPVSEEDLDKLLNGIELEDGPINADEISHVDGRDKSQVGIVIHSGRNRIVRRMFESLGYEVVKLDRVYYGGLTKLNVPRGHWRYLTYEEVNRLKAGFTK
ncbi:MAG: pseudouridine synthase, partial [Bacteroidales bacterium]|nr:pseudouridine synthase [Bacteroidales bacterium]